MEELTKYWDRYRKGSDYIQKKNLVARTNRNWKFFSGNQWDGIDSGGEELPFFNFIEPNIMHKVATVAQNRMIAKYSDAEGRDAAEMDGLYEKLDDLYAAAYEEANMDLETWCMMEDAAITGDGILYFGTADFRDVQRLQNTSVLYGDESNQKIQQQPYVIIVQRLPVGVLRKIAEQNGVKVEELASIVPDQETENLIGNRDEVNEDASLDSKATCIIHLERHEDGYIYIAQCTEKVLIEPERILGVKDARGNIVFGMTQYPLVKMAWKDYPNSARGVSDVEKLIPNQLEVNKTLARRALITKMAAYPRVVYDGNALTNPEDLDIVGAKIEMTTGGMQSVAQLMQYMAPAQISPEPKNLTDDLLDVTQELSGSGETAMGNINPSRVTSTTYLAIRDQAALPLSKQVAKLKTAIEDFARLVVEIKAVYNPNGYTFIKTATDEMGNEVQIPVTITADQIQKMMPEVRVDTSQDSPWAIDAAVQFLQGVYEKGDLTLQEYAEMAPKNSYIPKNQILKVLAKRMPVLPPPEPGDEEDEETEEDIAAQARAAWDSEESE